MWHGGSSDLSSKLNRILLCDFVKVDCSRVLPFCYLVSGFFHTDTSVLTIEATVHWWLVEYSREIITQRHGDKKYQVVRSLLKAIIWSVSVSSFSGPRARSFVCHQILAGRQYVGWCVDNLVAQSANIYITKLSKTGGRSVISSLCSCEQYIH